MSMYWHSDQARGHTRGKQSAAISHVLKGGTRGVYDVVISWLLDVTDDMMWLLRATRPITLGRRLTPK